MSTNDTTTRGTTVPEMPTGEREVPVAPSSIEKTPLRLYGAIFATAALAFLGLVLETVFNVLLPALMEDFHISMGTASWITSGYLLVIAVVMPLSGYLQRRFTARTLFAVAVAAFAVGVVIAASAPTFPLVLAGRLLQGAGTGIATPLMFTLILTQAPRDKVGSLMGIGAMTIGIAPALGPTVGGMIGAWLGWRAIFWVTLPILLAAGAVGMRCIRQATPTAREHLSIMQLLLLAVGMVGSVLGIERLGHALTAGAGGTALLTAFGLLALGLLGLTGFALRARRSRTPLIHLSVLRSRRFALSLLAYAGFQFATLGLGYMLPTYAQLGLGMSTLAAGFVALPGALVGAALAPMGGRLLDRVGARRPILIGAVVALAGAVLLAAIGVRFGIVGVSACQFIYMFGFGLAFSNTQTYGMGGVSRDLTADGTALMNTAQQFTASVSMTVLSAVLAFAQAGREMGSDAFAAASQSGAGACFWIIAGVLAVVVALEFAAHRRAADT